MIHNKHGVLTFPSRTLIGGRLEVAQWAAVNM